jgi:hypothetical protein
MDKEAKEQALARMAERIARDSESLPYRWGYFQGVMLIPWSLLVILTISMSNPRDYPWYLAAIGLSMGLLGLPLGYGLLRRKAFALKLVYAMFGLSLLLAAVKLPLAITHFADPGYEGSSFFEGELLLIWLLSMWYYRRRKAQFHQ